MTLELILGQMKKIDEYAYVGKVIRTLYTQNPEGTKQLVATLKPQHQEHLKEILQSKRIAIIHRGVRTTVARKVLKAKVRTNPVARSPDMP